MAAPVRRPPRPKLQWPGRGRLFALFTPCDRSHGPGRNDDSGVRNRTPGRAAFASAAALRAPVLVDHVDGAPPGQDRALLPAAQMAEMLAGEVERTVRLVEQRVLAVRARMVARGEAEVVGRVRPVDRHRLFELPASARMQSFDRGATLLELLAQRSFCQIVGVRTKGIGTEQDSLR